MKQNIPQVGFDVDDRQYRSPAFNKETGEIIDLCRWQVTPGFWTLARVTACAVA